MAENPPNRPNTEKLRSPSKTPIPTGKLKPDDPEVKKRAFPPQPSAPLDDRLRSALGTLSRANIPRLRPSVLKQFESGLSAGLRFNTQFPEAGLRLWSQDPEVQKLKKDILELQAVASKQATQLEREQADKAQQTAQLSELTATLNELTKKQELDFLLSRVSPEAEKAILGDPELREQFFSEKQQTAFVVSIDIRRSTELMLKARSPALFAAFMTQLCNALELAIKEEQGVFDKFTGDGVLAFFPEFFSGKDAGYHALAVAQKALMLFDKCYRQSRSSFTSILRDVNLTIGIDFGAVNLVQVAGGLTVVGGPVVYACRLSGGPPGSIFLNQPAYERISDAYGSHCLISETEIDIKHEGGIVCYELKPSNKPFEAASPSWIQGPVTASIKSES